MHRALQKVLLPLGLFVCAAPLWAAQTADEDLTKSVHLCRLPSGPHEKLLHESSWCDGRQPHARQKLFNMSRRNAAAYVEPDERKASVYV